MHLIHTTLAALIAATVIAVGCNRSEPVEDRTPAAAAPEQQRQQDTQRLEQQLAELEREWNETVDAMSKQVKPATAELRQQIQEDMAILRQEIAELRTTTAENWWQRQERELERAAEDVEQEVRQFARNWKSPESQEEVGTGGPDSAWEARRDRLVARLEQRIDAMEAALKDATTRDEEQARLEDTRARVGQMKQDAERLRNASEDDWWDVTKERVTHYMDRVEASIQRLKNDLG